MDGDNSNDILDKVREFTKLMKSNILEQKTLCVQLWQLQWLKYCNFTVEIWRNKVISCFRIIEYDFIRVKSGQLSDVMPYCECVQVA